MNRWGWVHKMVESELPSTSRLVAHTIASFADGKGHCYPSFTAIAKRSGLRRSTVAHHIKILADEGWLMVVNRVSKHGKQSNSYQLITPVDKPLPSPAGGLGVVRETDGVVRETDLLGRPGNGPRTLSQGTLATSDESESTNTASRDAVVVALGRAMRMP